jgi:hypothetical protein
MRAQLLALLLLLPTQLAAQPKSATESVTVTSTKSRQAIRGFVQSFTAPSRITGKLARWEDGVCPVTVGLKPAFTKFISQRIREVAAQAGAPVNSNAACENNIAVIFTKTPQALLDNIHKSTPMLLGYHDNSAQTDRAATMTRPIQAWYTTQTRDMDGKSEIDQAKHTGMGLRLPCDACGPNGYIYVPDADAWHTTGMHLGDGLHTSLYDVVVIADPTKLSDYEMGPLADYIALLALSQITSLDNCQTLPSIVNLLAANCAAKADALTGNDLAWLKGLYKMSPAANLGVQQDEVSYQMQQSLEGK